MPGLEWQQDKFLCVLSFTIHTTTSVSQVTMVERCGRARRRSSGALRLPRIKWRAATTRAAAAPAYGTAGVRNSPVEFRNRHSCGARHVDSRGAQTPAFTCCKARRAAFSLTNALFILRGSAPAEKRLLQDRALGLLVSTCGALLLHRSGSSISCQASSAQHFEVANCPAPQRVGRSSEQNCHSAHSVPQTAARILEGVPAHCIMSWARDHCERCHEPAGRERRRRPARRARACRSQPCELVRLVAGRHPGDARAGREGAPLS